MSAFLWDFRVELALNQTQELKVESVALSGQSIEVALSSLHSYANAVQAVTLSLLLLKQSSFYPKMAFHRTEYSHFCYSCEL